jgi:hypothetical protein
MPSKSASKPQQPPKMSPIPQQKRQALAKALRKPASMSPIDQVSKDIGN